MGKWYSSPVRFVIPEILQYNVPKIEAFRLVKCPYFEAPEARGSLFQSSSILAMWYSQQLHLPLLTFSRGQVSVPLLQLGLHFF
jgi:hypothetical protein